MYTKRVIAFIDILGFRNIISKTEEDQQLAEKIFKVLNSMNTDSISNEIFIGVSADLPEDKYKEAKEIADKFSKAQKSQSSIQVTHFSDSIVISIGLENDMNVMTVIEYLGRLMYKLWNEFKILIRGAVTMGDLIHNEDGALFGPAMVAAYDLETNLANYPRIIFDDDNARAIIGTPHSKPMYSLFFPCKAEKTVNGKLFKIEDGLEINLVTAIRHLLGSHFAFNEANRRQYQSTLDNLIPDLERLKAETDKAVIHEKYDYLINLKKQLFN